MTKWWALSKLEKQLNKQLKKQLNKQVSRAQTKKPLTTAGSLGIVGFCHIKIPNLGLIAKPSDHALKGADSEFLVWMGYCQRASLVVQMVKNLPVMQETWVWSLGWEDPLEKGMAIQSSILAWGIPWTKEFGRLQSTGCKGSDMTEWLTHTLSKGFQDSETETHDFPGPRPAWSPERIQTICAWEAGDGPGHIYTTGGRHSLTSSLSSKQLDTTATSWPPCLQAVATICDLQKGSFCPYCQGKHTDWNHPPWPGTIVTICMSYFTIGSPGKEQRTNKPTPTSLPANGPDPAAATGTLLSLVSSWRGQLARVPRPVRNKRLYWSLSPSLSVSSP